MLAKIMVARMDEKKDTHLNCPWVYHEFSLAISSLLQYVNGGGYKMRNGGREERERNRRGGRRFRGRKEEEEKKEETYLACLFSGI